MKTILFTLLSASLLSHPARAAEPAAPAPPPPAKPAAPAPVTPVKSLRNLGIHVGQTRTGGTRNQDANLPTLTALAPKEVARTISESPVFYWFSNGSDRVRFVFTLTLPKADQPLLETVVTGMKSAGVYGLELAAAGIQLELDRDYEWSVSTTVSGEASSKDIVSQGRVRRVAATPALTRGLAGAAANSRHEIFARSGMFYDAAAALLPLVEARPDDGKLRADLDQLFATYKIAGVGK